MMYSILEYATKIKPLRIADAGLNPLREAFRVRLVAHMNGDGAKRTALLFERAASLAPIDEREYGRWVLDRTSLALSYAASRLAAERGDGSEIEIFRVKNRHELGAWILAHLNRATLSRESSDLLSRVAYCAHAIDRHAPMLNASDKAGADGARVLMFHCVEAWALFARTANRERDKEVATWPLHQRILTTIFARSDLAPEWGWRDALCRIGQRFF
jgi:hypothetical protein